MYSDTTPNFVVYPHAPSMRFDGGNTLQFRIGTRRDDLTGVTCRVWLSGPDEERLLPAQNHASPEGSLYDTWSATLTVPESPQVTNIWHRFILSDGDGIAFYDADADDDPWQTRGMHDDPNRWQYDFHLIPGYDTPEWSREAVFYQVFPDRFANGNPDSDVLIPDNCFPYLDYSPALPEADPRCAEYAPISVPSNPKGSCEVHDSWSDAPNGSACDFFGGDVEVIRDQWEINQRPRGLRAVSQPHFPFPHQPKV